MRLLFPGVANKVANDAFLLLSASVLRAFLICATSYWTKGSCSSNPMAWKRASVRKASLSYSRMLFDDISVETEEKSLPNLVR
jgi:hypothetical protein